MMMPQEGTTTEEAIERDASYWAKRVRDSLTERGEEVTEKAALESLAVLDTEYAITADYDPDELEDFLEEFVEALHEVAEKQEVMEEAVEEASEQPLEEAPDAEED